MFNLDFYVMLLNKHKCAKNAENRRDFPFHPFAVLRTATVQFARTVREFI
jgi:hypothetical protein